MQGVVMFTRLRQPGGVLGGLSLTAALFLAVLGVVGVVSLLIAAAAGTEFWSDRRSDQLVSAVIFAVIAAGAVGFVIMDRRPWLGAAIGVIGSLLMALILFWALLPLVLGPVFAVVAVLRARVFAARSAAAGQAIA
jgi:ABC-type Mn2+/Zn2+ transport system permease subunit